MKSRIFKDSKVLEQQRQEKLMRVLVAISHRFAPLTETPDEDKILEEHGYILYAPIKCGTDGIACRLCTLQHPEGELVVIQPTGIRLLDETNNSTMLITDPNVLNRLVSLSEKGKTNPLPIAIQKEQMDKIEQLLKKGFRLSDHYELEKALEISRLRSQNFDAAILELLQQYNALPPDVNVPTIKFILFLSGHTKIKWEDFWNNSELNLQGCQPWRTPMSIACRHNKKEIVRLLIERGVQDRPISELFCHTTKIGTFEPDLYNVEWLPPHFTYELKQVEQACEMTEMLISYPNDALYANLEKETTLQPFSAWIARNNRVDLLENPFVQALHRKYPEAFESASLFAVIFNSREYLQKTVAKLPPKAICILLSTALAMNDNAQFVLIMEQLDRAKFDFGGLEFNSVESDIQSPLYWALNRCSYNVEAASMLLSRGAKPSNYPQLLPSEKDSYLHHAIRTENANMIRLFLEHGFSIVHKDENGMTPLHEACKRGLIEIAVLMISQLSADIHELDNSNKSPLDYIQDAKVKEKLEDEFFVKNLFVSHSARR